LLSPFPDQGEEQQCDANQTEGNQQTDAMAGGVAGLNRPELQARRSRGRELVLRFFGALQGIVNEAHAWM
jgi:hypothetical protein